MTRWAGAHALRSVSSDYTATLDDDTILVDATSGPVTVTLPSAVGCAGKPFTIRRTNPGANVVTVAAAGGQTIGTAASTSFKLLARNALLTGQSDGANYQIVNRRDALGTLKPTTIVREAIDPWLCITSASITSGVLNLFAVEYLAGDILTGIAFNSGGTPGSAMTHQVFGLFDTDGVTLLKGTVDNGSTAWGTSTKRQLAWSGGGTYTIPYDGAYYHGIFVVGTPPTLRSIASTTDTLDGPPILHGTADTGLNQSTMPNPAAAMTVAGSRVRTYGY